MPLRRVQQYVPVQVRVRGRGRVNGSASEVRGQVPCPMPHVQLPCHRTPVPCRASAGCFSSVCRSILQGFVACQGQQLETSSEIWAGEGVGDVGHVLLDKLLAP